MNKSNRPSYAKIFLIRHGETEWTKHNRHTGLSDIPLTEVGKKQVAWLKAVLDSISFTQVLCSPLARAVQTCQLAMANTPFIFDPDLVEWNYGDYEGKTTQEIHQLDPEWSIFSKGAPNGESIADVEARANRVLAKMENMEGNIALFSSGHFLRSLASRWLSFPVSCGAFFALSTASLSILGYERKTKVFLRWNQTNSL